jgi:hypothetical protein
VTKLIDPDSDSKFYESPRSMIIYLGELYVSVVCSSGSGGATLNNEEEEERGGGGVGSTKVATMEEREKPRALSPKRTNGPSEGRNSAAFMTPRVYVLTCLIAFNKCDF